MHPNPIDVGGLVASLLPRVEALLPTLVDVAQDLHAHPEIRFTEHHAAARLTSELETAGFEVQRGFAGLETAFLGRWSAPGADESDPTIAIFCEYDALEEIGHACGHNLIAACGLGASFVAREMLESGEHGRAHLLVVGSPGEEGAAGKVPMIEAGVLDGVDLAVMTHPSGSNVADAMSLSRVALDVDFHGRASHAAAAPHLGINALDAATLALNAIGLLRQQLADDVRVHSIITNGGEAPNIIPEHTSLRTFVRAADRAHLLEDVLPRVRACFEGAGIATGCSVEIAENTPPYFSMRSNPVLVDLAEQAFGALGREIDRTPGALGSTDMGNVSEVVPAIHPMIELAPDLTTHTREFAAAAGGPGAASTISDGGSMLAAVVLAASSSPAIVEAARDAFRAMDAD